MEMVIVALDSKIEVSDIPHPQYLCIRYKNKLPCTNYFISYKENLEHMALLQKLNLKLMKLGSRREIFPAMKKSDLLIGESHCTFINYAPDIEDARSFVINTQVNRSELNNVLAMQTNQLFDYLEVDGILKLFSSEKVHMI